MSTNVVEIFKAAVSPLNARIDQLPPIILVFGGQLGGSNKSARQIFINWISINKPTISDQIRTPEQFEDWNNFAGYSNLVDFEIDAGHLTKAIILFSESEGAYAELGSFCTDPILSERLFVAIEKKYYEAPSFIANGPIKKIELHHDHSVCVLDTLDPTKVCPQLPDLTSALEEKLATLPKTLGFQPDRHRDQFLLIADLIDLFGALTQKELYELIQVMGVKIDYEHLSRITSQLLRFELIRFVPGTTKRFFVAPPDRIAYLNYSGHPGAPVFDRGRFKLLKVTPWLNADKSRLKAYQEIHPKA
ncbi:retron St85 family effector protein [Methylomonas paludis]|uniref:Retron St85 family effector protein n=1 Tax=Methylomonas paludis TaxID=1173101 RepID=A0A975MNF1_9GAMM|nr:retron St85 family effector protein [Methylomonas paludis]QWF70571.1 retron St85 family effector protein [Methylomonas paludis]